MIAQYTPDLGQWPLSPPAQPGPPIAEWAAAQRCPVAPRKPPASVHIERYSQPGSSDSPTRDLERTYVIDDRRAIHDFLQSNRSVLSLLRDATGALSLAFGQDAIKILRVTEDDEGTRAVFCLVAFRGDLHDAMRALRSFDENWWLDRCARVAGKLNFDFELV